MKRVVIHQPDFVPYLGFFDRLLTADVFVILDDVQFLRRGWHHRDKIKTARGADWLTLNVAKGDYHAQIRDIDLHADRGHWIPGHLNLLRDSYASAAHFDDHFPAIEETYNRHHRKLIDLNMDFIGYLNSVFDIDIEIVLASSLAVAKSRTERLVELVTAVGGTHYLSGTGALVYLEPERFRAAGITLEIQDFRHPEYPQLHGAFIPSLSSLDVILNCGRAARDVVRRCRP